MPELWHLGTSFLQQGKEYHCVNGATNQPMTSARSPMSKRSYFFLNESQTIGGFTGARASNPLLPSAQRGSGRCGAGAGSIRINGAWLKRIMGMTSLQKCPVWLQALLILLEISLFYGAWLLVTSSSRAGFRHILLLHIWAKQATWKAKPISTKLSYPLERQCQDPTECQYQGTN